MAEEEEVQHRQPAAVAAAEALLAGSGHQGVEQEDEDADSEPERSLLSRAGSISGLPRRAPPPRQRSRLAFCAKTSVWFTGTLLLGLLLSIGLVVLAFPPPGQAGVPSCRSGAAVAVLPGAQGSNASAAQHLIVWSGRGQSGAMYKGLYSFKCASPACLRRILSWKMHGVISCGLWVASLAAVAAT